MVLSLSGDTDVSEGQPGAIYDLVRVPDPLPQEMDRGTNVFKSGEFFFTASHSSKKNYS